MSHDPRSRDLFDHPIFDAICLAVVPAAFLYFVAHVIVAIMRGSLPL